MKIRINESGIRKQTLPVIYIRNNKCVLGDKITCEPYGEMSDGTMVWADDEDNQYQRIRVNGKYYFIEF